MWLSKEQFPILEIIRNNKLTQPLKWEWAAIMDEDKKKNIDNLWYEDDLKEIHNKFQDFPIHYITKPIEKLLRGNSFDKALSLIDQLPNCNGLILHRDFLLEELNPEFSSLDAAIFNIWYRVHDFEFDEDDVDLDEFRGHKVISYNFNASVFSEFTLLPITGKIYSPHEFNTRQNSAIEKFIANFLLFYHFTEPTIKEVTGGTSTKKLILKDDKIINDSPNKIEIIDENFFTTVIRTNGFGVNGHFRLQPVGAGRLSRKLVYIEPFEKNGYTRRAKISQHEK